MWSRAMKDINPPGTLVFIELAISQIVGPPNTSIYGFLPISLVNKFIISGLPECPRTRALPLRRLRPL